MSGIGGVFLGGHRSDEHGFGVVLHDEEGAAGTLGIDGYDDGGEEEMES